MQSSTEASIQELFTASNNLRILSLYRLRANCFRNRHFSLRPSHIHRCYTRTALARFARKFWRGLAAPLL